MQQANRWQLLQIYITEEAAEGSLVCLAGGTHHAFADRGEGFCVFNDIAVSARMAMAEEGIERVLVIDLDVHQVWHKEYSAAHLTFVRGHPSPAREIRSTAQQLTGRSLPWCRGMARLQYLREMNELQPLMSMVRSRCHLASSLSSTALLCSKPDH